MAVQTANRTFKPMSVYDAVRSLPGGHDNGTDPLLIPRTKASFLRNATVRGNFVRPRGAYRVMTLDYSQGDGTVQPGVEQGLFQCAGYYKPDVGNESLMLLASGRLFQLSISGQTATVYERSISGDLDVATAPIGWMWQSENFMIVNDGVSRPIFFDGLNSRRAGDGLTITTLGADFTTPAIGAASNATLSATYSGPYNVLVGLDDGTGSSGLFILNSSSIGVQVTLDNLGDTVGATRTTNTILQYLPYIVGVASPVSYTVPDDSTITVQATAIYNIPSVGDFVQIPATAATSSTGAHPSQVVGNLVGFAGPNPIIKFTNLQHGSTLTLSNASTMTNISVSGGTNYTVAQNFTVPAVNSTVAVYFKEAFTTNVGLITLFLSTDVTKMYRVTAVSTPAPGTIVSLTNHSATAAHVFAAATPTNVNHANELPPGKAGAYWLGRNWEELTDEFSFVASDIVGGNSGTDQYQKRDAPLRIYENSFLAGGGVFRVPGNTGGIRAIIPTAQLDSSLGQGPLSVVTPKTIFSCLAPVDRTTWQNLTNPILPPSVLGNGGQSQNSTVPANSDFFYRSTDGLRSQILARRDFDTWGNVPVSFEVSPTIDQDNPSLLQYASAVVFNNRLLHTANPVQSPFGVYHPKLVALNFDPLSSLQGKMPSVYDGIWDGLNVLQLVVGSFTNVERCFAFCVSQDQSKIELWEILPTDGPLSLKQDVGPNGTTSIQWGSESGSLNFFEDDPRRREDLCLKDGEIRIDSMVEDVKFEVSYKPDQYPTWVPWITWTEKFNGSSDSGFRPSLGFGEPRAKPADDTNDRPLREAVTYQVKLQITGYCRILWQRFLANTVASPPFAPAKDI